MKCPDALTHTTYLDKELDIEGARVFESHLGFCSECRQRQLLLKTENDALREAMQFELQIEEIPVFAERPAKTQWFFYLLALGLCSWLIGAAWVQLNSSLILPGWLHWLLPSMLELSTDAVRYVRSFINNGGDLMTNSLKTIGGTVCALGLMAMLLRPGLRRAAPLCMVLLLVSVSFAYAPQSYAVDIRHDDERVTIDATETIEDTVFVASDIVVIETDIDGDLFVAGEEVSIRSKVSGNIFAAGETLELNVEVGGSVFTAGETITLESGSITGNLYAAGEEVFVNKSLEISGNTMLAAETAKLDGTIGRDLMAAGDSVSLLGKVSRNLRFYGNKLKFEETALVGGDLHAKVDDLSKVSGLVDGTVQGEYKIDESATEPEEETKGGYIVGRLLKLLAAFVFSLLLFWLLPSLRRTSVSSGSELLSSAGIGTITFVSMPILAILIMFTLIGIPIGIAALFLWIIALYAAGLVTAAFIGDSVMSSRDHNEILVLFVGLIILYILTSIPVVGGAVWLIAVLIGLGIIVRWVRESREDRSYE